jgi:antitoxin ParD1/3/4
MDKAKLKALKQAARQGWPNVSAERYVDVAHDQLEKFMRQLGRRAAQRAHGLGVSKSATDPPGDHR